MLMLNWTMTIRIVFYDMGYVNLVDTRQKEKVNKMSNQELNAIIIGQTIVMAVMFIIVVLLMTNN
jgi:hypothetical protein